MRRRVETCMGAESYAFTRNQPSAGHAAVSPSPFASLGSLSTLFRSLALPSGKRFELQCFRPSGGRDPMR